MNRTLAVMGMVVALVLGYFFAKSTKAVTVTGPAAVDIRDVTVDIKAGDLNKTIYVYPENSQIAFVLISKSFSSQSQIVQQPLIVFPSGQAARTPDPNETHPDLKPFGWYAVMGNALVELFSNEIRVCGPTTESQCDMEHQPRKIYYHIVAIYK